jgi:protein ImuB
MDHGPAAAALAGYVGRAAEEAAPGDGVSGRREDRDRGAGEPRMSAARPWATAERTMALWCADWPLVAAGVAPEVPAVVLHGGRTVACTPAARAEGVHRGMRRRDAEARCPRLAVLDHDPARDVRAFEPVAAAVEAFAPRVELTRSGLCSVATRGPSRYFGGDEPLAARVVAAVREVLGQAAAHVGAGVADGTFAASLAARATAGGAPVLVLGDGETVPFLAGLPVSALSAGTDDGRGVDMAELASLLVRLGLRTLGAVAALPETDLVARFGTPGGVAWRRSRGLDDRPLDARDPPPDLAAQVVLDPPADRVDAAAFAARTLAADLHGRLDTKGLACTRLTIEALTTDGVRLSRVWRHEGRFTPGATAERVRWQLDGWLTTTARTARESEGAARPDREGDAPGDVGGRPEGGGLVLLRLVPEEVVAGGGRQLGFWGGDAEADERAARALARVQGLLGPAAVVTAVASGGRGPRLRATLVPWGDPREPAQPGGQATPAAIELGPAADRPEVVERPVRRPKRGMGAAAGEVPPWPGRIPGPPPAVVPVEREPVEVVDATGAPVVVSGRAMASAAPARVVWSGGAFEVHGWAGPWPVEERWWDPAAAARLARIQVTAPDGTALLLACESGSWWLEALYD